MMKVGILGFGQMGILHSALVNTLPGSHISAICDKNSTLVKLARKSLPDIAFYSDYLEMVDREDLDAVYITTPVSLHVPMITELTRRDNELSLFVEKPLASTFDQALQAIEAVRTSKGKMTVGYQKRFAGTFRKVKEILENGTIGSPKFFRSHFYTSDILEEKHGWKFEEGTGGAALEFGPHLIDLIQWYFGIPKTTHVVRKSVYSRKVEDFFNCVFEFDRGVVGSSEVCWSMINYRPYELQVEIHCEEGALVVNEDNLVVYSKKPIAGVLREGPNVFNWWDLTPPLPFLFSHPELVLEDEHFTRCVQSSELPMTSFESAANVNKTIDTIRRAPLQP